MIHSLSFSVDGNHYLLILNSVTFVRHIDGHTTVFFSGGTSQGWEDKSKNLYEAIKDFLGV